MKTISTGEGWMEESS